MPARQVDDALEQRYINALRQTARTYGIEFIALNRMLHQQAGLSQAYRQQPDNPNLITDYPIQLTQTIANWLTETIAK